MRANPLLQVVFGALIAAHAWAFEEGIDYTRLANPQAPESGEEIEVLEVFMYSCPHCFYLEPTLEEWLKTKPEQVGFKRMPAIFGVEVIPHAKAYYAAEALGEIDRFHLPLFRALHGDQGAKRAIWDEDALVAFAEKQGIDAKRFRETYRSFSVDNKVRQAWELGKRFGIDSVPTLIVDGKYRTSPSQTGSYEKTIQVVDYLIGIETDRSSATAAGGS
ncbi:MAG: thiol:disulfide interchange protein DsbA/DsbL [Candidatus Thiosymbion ectosymbiont of Robbea hypermnestra]|nr:thiol:disulfide interchange protein DsbA/DsbL [Candidatus Thiosymbion ectosymbiont of Robbea hypermnestra]